MTTFLRSLRLVALAVWVGSLVFFIFVAGVAFRTLPDAHSAGLVVRGSLLLLHQLGLVMGLAYLLITLALLGTQRDSHPARAVELVLVLLMLAGTAYSQFSIIPQMESDRLSLGGDVAKSPQDAPARRNFDRLHNLSVDVEGCVLVAGLLLLIAAPIHGREDYDQFA